MCCLTKVHRTKTVLYKTEDIRKKTLAGRWNPSYWQFPNLTSIAQCLLYKKNQCVPIFALSNIAEWKYSSPQTFRGCKCWYHVKNTDHWHIHRPRGDHTGQHEYNKIKLCPHCLLVGNSPYIFGCNQPSSLHGNVLLGFLQHYIHNMGNCFEMAIGTKA